MRVIGTLAVMAAAAFVFGAGAGLLWKDPSLVLAHWMGGTQEVAWSEEGGPDAGAPARAGDEAFETASAGPARPADPARVAEAPPPPQKPLAPPAPPAAVAKAAPRGPALRVARADPAAAAAPPALRALPPVSAPPPAVAAAPPHGLAVQVGAFTERHAADDLVSRLHSAGFQAYVSAADGSAWRVRVGPFADRARAEQAAGRLKQQQKLPTWILEETGGR